MTDAKDLERLLVEHHDHVSHVARAVCRRSGLDAGELDDCESWVKLRLIEHDYAILRKFRGESSLKTYLTVVVSMLVRDYRTQRWGRWRPSAAALRLGPIAVRLETLTHRDGMRFEEACNVIRRTTDGAPAVRELAQIAEKLPVRGPLRPREVEVEAGLLTAGPAGADTAFLEDERARDLARAEELIAKRLADLPAEDRCIVQMVHLQGLSVADVSRALGVAQKPLYRRIERLMAQLRAELEANGVTAERVRSLIGGEV